MFGARRPLSVVFVNHSGFHSNSSHHIAGFAEGLQARGHRIRVVADGDPAGCGLPPGVGVDVARVGDVESGLEPLLKDPATLIHAWTPRERVRRTVETLARGRLRHVVHLEDHEEIITSAFMERSWEELTSMDEADLDQLTPDNLSHPLRYRRFLAAAAGVTVIVRPLRALVPSGPAVALLEPGVDGELIRPRLAPAQKAALRQELGISPSTTIIFHPGAMHAANARDILSLYAAIGLLRGAGRDVVLVRTGHGSPDGPACSPLDVRDLGFVPRDRLLALLDLADVCVQPGGPTAFNVHRFPSKLPEFLAMRRATITAATNVGLRLRDGREALLLGGGAAEELATAIARLDADPGLRERLGRRARQFAMRRLRWPDRVRELERFYWSLANQ